MNIFAGVFTFLIFLLTVHPLHVSVTEIEMDEKDKRLEIMMRVFIDDMEMTLRKNLNQPTLDIQKPVAATTDQLVANYLKDHFRISLDNKLQKNIYLGHEVEGEAFIFYTEVSNVKKWKSIQVTNDIFMETFEDQSNLVHVTAGGNVRSLRLTASTPTDKLSFDFK
jgi:hypothetical protein